MLAARSFWLVSRCGVTGKTRSSPVWGVPGLPLRLQLAGSLQLDTVTPSPVQVAVAGRVRSSRVSIRGGNETGRGLRREANSLNGLFRWKRSRHHDQDIVTSFRPT